MCSYSEARRQSLDIFQGDINSHNPQDELALKFLGFLKEKQRRKRATHWMSPVPPCVRTDFKEMGPDRNLDSFIPQSFTCRHESLTRYFQLSSSAIMEVTLNPLRETCKLILKHLSYRITYLTALQVWFLFFFFVLWNLRFSSCGGTWESFRESQRPQRIKGRTRRKGKKKTKEGMIIDKFMLLIYFLSLVKIQTKALMSSLLWGQSFKWTVNLKKNCGAQGCKRCRKM